MSDTITVRFAGMGGTREVTIESGATVAEAREAAGVDAALSVRSGGETLRSEDRVEDEQLLVASAPEAKQGS